MQVCRFKFNREVDREVIEWHIAQSILASEGVFGQAKVRLNAAYLAADNKVVIDVSSPVGENIAEVFTWRMTKEFGEESFSVERIRHEGQSGIKANL
jgi:hypothetical protein